MHAIRNLSIFRIVKLIHFWIIITKFNINMTYEMKQKNSCESLEPNRPTPVKYDRNIH